MLNKANPSKKNSDHSRGAVIGGIIGGITGSAIAIITNIFSSTSIASAMIWIVSCAFVGSIIGALAGNDRTHNTTSNSVNIPLREEQLKVSKNKIQTGKVTMHKEVSTEEKNITVPVKHEELVIEKTNFDSESPNTSDAHTKTVRIPLSEERIDIQKHTVPLEDVSVSKHQYEEVKHVTETLRKEIPHISTSGNVKIHSDNTFTSKNMPSKN